ncbi:universal stress protein [Paraburkholderia sp. NMBU_R16]|uniref:universal stress protein n=1 Tax=Paraburkholderia sp. NMBU_R16 TaxID=2698676 RepID=UPI0015642CAE|nr:universal stress protein [Paraburkholderia sp. NMBU_R16]NRO96979.1 universal stress protein [Paraburkholderia sp. NMBU_R16]
MNTSTSSSPTSTLPGKVLIAVDSSAASRQAVAYARTIVAQGGTVRLVSVAENPRTLVPTGSFVGEALGSARAELLRDAADALAVASEAFAKCNIRVETDAIDLSTHGGDVVHALIEAADTWQAELLVVGTRQHHGLLRWIEGTISEPLAKLSRCPILIVPAAYTVKADRPPERILYAVDGSRQAMAALHYGVRFATHDAHVRAVYVVDRAVRLGDFVPIDALEAGFVDEGTRAIAQAEPILAGVSGRSSTALIRTARTDDDVAHAIVREAGHWQADLIVMGTHGRRGVARWMLGTVAGRVAQLSEIPLLLVHALKA